MIDCDQTYECRSKQLICPESGDCTVNCNAIYGCLDAVITCSGRRRNCIINCGVHSCRHASMICPRGANCTINCNNTYSCFGANILCQQDSNCTINCRNGDFSCSKARFVSGDGNVNVNCNDLYGCFEATLICSFVGINSCNINCSVDSNSCTDVSVDNSNYGSVTCCRSSSCSRGQITNGLVTCP